MKKINIREALLKLDKDSCCRYDLTTLYESCKLDDEDKVKLVQYIDAYEHPSIIGGFLESKCDCINESYDDDDVSDIAGAEKVVKEINENEVPLIFSDDIDDEEEVKTIPLTEEVVKSDAKEVRKYVWDKILPFDNLTDDDSYYWEFDQDIRDGFAARLVSDEIDIPDNATYKFSLPEVGLNFFLQGNPEYCYYVIDKDAVEPFSKVDEAVEIGQCPICNRKFAEGELNSDGACPKCGEHLHKTDSGAYEKTDDDLDESVDVESIVGWLAEHDQAYDDALAHFKTDDLNSVSESDLIDWIGEHDQLYQDYLNFFKLEEGLWDDIKSVGKTVGKVAKKAWDNSYTKAIGTGLKKAYDKSDLGKATKEIGDSIKATDTYKKVAGKVSDAKDFVKNNVGSRQHDPQKLSIEHRGKNYRMSDLKYKLDGKAISPEEYASLGMLKRNKAQIIVPRGAKPIQKESLNLYEAFNLCEDVDTAKLSDSIKTELNMFMRQQGFDASDVDGYTAVEIKDAEDNMIQVEVRAELSYDDLMELSNELDPMVQALDRNAYFEPVTSGIMRAYIRKDQSDDIADEEAVAQWTDKINACKSIDDLREVYLIFNDQCDNNQYSGGTIDAVLEVVHNKLDALDESLNESKSINEDIDDPDEVLNFKRDVESANDLTDIQNLIWSLSDGVAEESIQRAFYENETEDLQVVKDAVIRELDIYLEDNEWLGESINEDRESDILTIKSSIKNNLTLDNYMGTGSSNYNDYQIELFHDSDNYGGYPWWYTISRDGKVLTKKCYGDNFDNTLYSAAQFIYNTKSKSIKESFHKDGWVLRYDNGDHYVYWTADDDYTPDITNPKIMIYDSEDMALSDVSDVKKIYAELTDYEDAIFEPVHTSELSTNESESINEDVNYDDEEQYAYVVHFDEDGQNMDKWFYADEKEKAIKYAKENLIDGPVLYEIDEDGIENAIDYFFGDEIDESKSIKEEFNIQDYYNQTLNKFNNIHSNINDDYDTFETGVELAIQDLTDETNKSELFRCNNREEVKTFTDKLSNTREYDTLKVYPEVRSGYYAVIDYLNRLVYRSKSIKESAISRVEPVVKFRGKSSHTFTPDKKWEVDFDEEGNVLARTRQGKPYYFSGHINDKTNEFGHTDEDAIIQAAREQHKSKFGENDSINESADSMIYLFPELTDEDLEMAKGYGLTFLGKNHGADGSEDNWVLRGAESSLRMFADKYLGYELHPDYLYDEDEFAGDIINEDFQDELGEARIAEEAPTEDSELDAREQIGRRVSVDGEVGTVIDTDETPEETEARLAEDSSDRVITKEEILNRICELEDFKIDIGIRGSWVSAESQKPDWNNSAGLVSVECGNDNEVTVYSFAEGARKEIYKTTVHSEEELEALVAKVAEIQQEQLEVYKANPQEHYKNSYRYKERAAYQALDLRVDEIAAIVAKYPKAKFDPLNKTVLCASENDANGICNELDFAKCQISKVRNSRTPYEINIQAIIE